MLRSFMLSVTYKPFMLNAIMLNVVMLNVVILSVVTTMVGENEPDLLGL